MGVETNAAVFLATAEMQKNAENSSLLIFMVGPAGMIFLMTCLY